MDDLRERQFQKLEQVRKVLNNTIRGKEEAVEMLLVGLFSGGHILIEDVPGVGKTSLAKALAKCIESEFQRVQFTPDLLPADITGGPIYSQKEEEFKFREGPIFTNILLADEINRASPRTQSALLEAMGESQATIAGSKYELPAPFVVIATQNSIDYHGTFPLPEAQLDRFAISFSMNYPDMESEIALLTDRRTSDPIDAISAVLNIENFLEIQKMIRDIKVDESLTHYIVEILNKSRVHSQLSTGCSPRAGLILYRCAQSRAYLQGRDYVIPEDIHSLAVPVLAHRLHIKKQAKNAGITNAQIVADFLSQAKAPH